MDGPQKVVAYIFAVVFAVVGIAALVYAFTHHSLEASLSANGAHVTGRVISGNAEWMGQGDSNSGNQDKYSYSLHVQYETKQGARYNSFGVTQSAYGHYGVGSPIEVVYDPNDPDTALLSGAGLNSNPSWMYFLMGTAFSVFGIGLFIAIPIYLRGLKQGDPPSLDEALRNAELRGSGPT